MKTGSRIKMLSGALALAALLWPFGAEGQEVRLIRPDGRVRADDGGWRAATPADALRVLRDPGVQSPYRVAQAVLRQVHEPRSPGELDALADALAEILVATAAEDRDSKAYMAASGALFWRGRARLRGPGHDARRIVRGDGAGLRDAGGARAGKRGYGPVRGDPPG